MTIALPGRLRFIERDWLSSNQVVGFDDRGAVVVDTGYDKHSGLTTALLRHLCDGAGAPLRRIVNTHLHSDHCGGNAALVRELGCEITIPRSTATIVERWDEDALSFRATGQRCERFVHHDTLAPGDEFELGGLDWQVLAAPGHDPDSLVFHCPAERLLISADALWENGFGVIFPELAGESGFDEQQAVLEAIARLDVDIVLPGHGPAFTDVKAALARAFSRLDALRADPRRNARGALKVLVKFHLLDHERVHRERMIETLAEALMVRLAAGMIGLPAGEALRRSADELVRGGQLREDAGWLVNA